MVENKGNPMVEGYVTVGAREYGRFLTVGTDISYKQLRFQRLIHIRRRYYCSKQGFLGLHICAALSSTSEIDNR